jgi:hypothetical protein
MRGDAGGAVAPAYARIGKRYLVGHDLAAVHADEAIDAQGHRPQDRDAAWDVPAAARRFIAAWNDARTGAPRVRRISATAIRPWSDVPVRFQRMWKTEPGPSDAGLIAAYT